MITPAYSPTATERVLPRLALDFTTASLDPRVTVTRALNTATRFNSSGYIEVVNADLPRFDYDPTTLTCKGLLIEEGRTNIVPEVNNWTTFNAGLTPDVVISPTGTQTGDLFAENTATDTHLLYRAPTLAAAAHTFSVFYKIVGDRKLALYHSATNTGRQFDANGVQSAGLFNAPSGGYTVTSVGNGWYRASITVTAAAGANEFRFWIVRASDNALNYTGDGVSGAYLYGVQIEAGAFASSYIPTAATGNIARNSDAVEMTGANFSDWYNQTEGTFSAWFDTIAAGGSSNIWAMAAADATPSGRIMIGGNPSNLRGFVSAGGTTQADMFSGTIANNAQKKAIITYKENSFAFSTGGLTPATDAIGTLPTPTRLWIGQYNGTYLYGHIAKLLYWPQRIINAEAQAFSK